MPGTISAEDKVAVMNLIADYAFRLDTADLDGYVDNFTPDGVFDGGGGRIEGRTAIREYVGKLLQNRPPGSTGGLRHVMGIPSIQEDGRGDGGGERCRALTYVMIPGSTDDGQIRVAMTGLYTDDIVKLDGRWRFAVRHIRMALTSPRPT
jgi:ketosteroid isomerase-like protein